MSAQPLPGGALPRRCVLHPDAVFDGETLRHTAVVVDDGRLILAEAASAVVPGPAIALPGVLAPGFLDLQVNGAGGVLFNAAPTVATLARMVDAVRATGTAFFLPTLITDTADVTAAAVAAVDAAIAAGLPGILGIHLEGPFLNPARAGVHRPDLMAPATRQAVAALPLSQRGATLVTLAPERAEPGAIADLAGRGAVVFAGHTEADFATMEQAAADGLCGATHVHNAMAPATAREPAAVGAALALDSLFAGLICDGHHVHPAQVKLLLRAKPADRAVLVSDAMPTLGADFDRFDLLGQDVRLADGRLVTPEGRLAGAHLRLDRAVANAMAFAGIDLARALAAVTRNPAKALGLWPARGSLEGTPGALTLFDPAAGTARVLAVA
ncbi:MAG: N-acetylglucosamine-6-phosphate deacetylase [Rhodospirillaceae bacterium]|nr:N-acetylglucosamine-6-phosphate deacetylase [Rhodospirillaceae bacterium]